MERPGFVRLRSEELRRNYAAVSHIRVKLLLPISVAEAFALEGADALEALAWLAREDIASTELLDKSRFLHLLLETLLQAVIGLFAFLDCVNSHKAAAG